MPETPQRVIVCMADHDHEFASDAECPGHAKQASIDLTPAEIQQLELDAIAEATRKAEQEAAEAAKQALKDSAKAKLVAGEPLTEEEAALLTL